VGGENLGRGKNEVKRIADIRCPEGSKRNGGEKIKEASGQEMGRGEGDTRILLNAIWSQATIGEENSLGSMDLLAHGEKKRLKKIGEGKNYRKRPLSDKEQGQKSPVKGKKGVIGKKKNEGVKKVSRRQERWPGMPGIQKTIKTPRNKKKLRKWEGEPSVLATTAGRPFKKKEGKT